MPDDALMEFPPGLGYLSNMWTLGIVLLWWVISWVAAARPARPDPTTMMGGGVWRRKVDGVVILSM